jgi:hypothetical protein
MASPKKKWLRAKLAEQEAQQAEVEVQPEPVVEKRVNKPAATPSKRIRRK